MIRPRVLNLLALLAFAAAQVEFLDHRARHAAEGAEQAAAFLCRHDEEAVHLCAARAEPDHAPDCALCSAGTVLADPAAAGPGRVEPPVLTRAGVLDQGVPLSAPDAGLSVPRGPPVL